jgi:hypothetical protein
MHLSCNNQAGTTATVAVATPILHFGCNEGTDSDERNILSDLTDRWASAYDMHNVSTIAKGCRNIGLDLDSSNTGNRRISLIYQGVDNRPVWLFNGPTPGGPWSWGPELLGPIPKGPGHGPTGRK